MKKQIISNGIVYFICMIAACLLNLGVSALAVKITNILVAPDFFVIAIVRVVSAIVTSCIVLGAVVGYEGYKSVSFSLPLVLLSVLIASVAHFAISFVLKFYPFISGGTHYLGGIIENGSDFNSFSSVADVSLGAYIVAFWIAKGVELAVAPLCAYFGKKVRLKNRESIVGYSDNFKGKNI
jgi:hypothetical protein